MQFRRSYGIWYIDCMDRRDRYEGKIVEFTAMVLKSPEFPKNYFVPGRMAMTCCEADMTFLGFVTKAREAKDLQTKQWVKVRARIAYEFWKDYEAKALCSMRSPSSRRSHPGRGTVLTKQA